MPNDLNQRFPTWGTSTPRDTREKSQGVRQFKIDTVLAKMIENLRIIEEKPADTKFWVTKMKPRIIKTANSKGVSEFYSPWWYAIRKRLGTADLKLSIDQIIRNRKHLKASMTLECLIMPRFELYDLLKLSFSDLMHRICEEVTNKCFLLCLGPAFWSSIHSG